MSEIVHRMCDCGTWYDSEAKIEACIAEGHGIEELTRLRAREAVLVEALQAAHDNILLGLLSLGFNKAEGDSSSILTKIEKALATLDVEEKM